MLGKTMKYEFVANGRALLPVFGAAVAMSGVFRFLLFLAPRIWDLAGAILAALVATMGTLLPIAVIIVTFALVVMRFFRSMTGPEAYLSFTLPVSVNAHLISRIFVSSVFLLASCLVAVVCSYIFLPGFDVFSMDVNTGTGSSFVLSMTSREIQFMLLLVLWAVLLLLVTFVCQQIMVYHAISLSVSRTRNRVLYSVGFYLLLNTIINILYFSVFIGIGYAWSNSGGMRTFFRELTRLPSEAQMWHMYGFLWAVLGIMTAVMGLVAAAEYLHMKHMFTKKLNLE